MESSALPQRQKKKRRRRPKKRKRTRSPPQMTSKNKRKRLTTIPETEEICAKLAQLQTGLAAAMESGESSHQMTPTTPISSPNDTSKTVNQTSVFTITESLLHADTQPSEVPSTTFQEELADPSELSVVSHGMTKNPQVAALKDPSNMVNQSSIFAQRAKSHRAKPQTKKASDLTSERESDDAIQGSLPRDSPPSPSQVTAFISSPAQSSGSSVDPTCDSARSGGDPEISRSNSRNSQNSQRLPAACVENLELPAASVQIIGTASCERGNMHAGEKSQLQEEKSVEDIEMRDSPSVVVQRPRRRRMTRKERREQALKDHPSLVITRLRARQIRRPNQIKVSKFVRKLWAGIDTAVFQDIVSHSFNGGFTTLYLHLRNQESATKMSEAFAQVYALLSDDNSTVPHEWLSRRSQCIVFDPNYTPPTRQIPVSHSVIIRGVPDDVDANELHEELTPQLETAPISVRQFPRMPLFEVRLASEDEVQKLLNTTIKVGFTKVTTERPHVKPPRPRPGRLRLCKSCYRLGHESPQCRSAPVCKFCSKSNHKTEKCHHKNDPSKHKCRLCKGNHKKWS